MLRVRFILPSRQENTTGTLPRLRLALSDPPSELNIYPDSSALAFSSYSCMNGIGHVGRYGGGNAGDGTARLWYLDERARPPAL